MMRIHYGLESWTLHFEYWYTLIYLSDFEATYKLFYQAIANEKFPSGQVFGFFFNHN